MLSIMKVKGSTQLSIACVIALGAAASCALTSGCSLLYNVDNLSPPAVDATDTPPPPDVLDPNALMLASVLPADLYEGQGANGSPQAFLVLAGSNISEQAEITLVPTTAGDALPMYTLDVAHLAHAADNSVVAVPVNLPVDPAAGVGDIKVTVHIKQTGKMGEDIVADLAGQVTIHTLPELDDLHATVPPSIAPILYSQVTLTKALVIDPLAGATPTIIHSMSTIAMTDITLETNGSVPGRGGNIGGAATKNGAGLGGGLGGGVLGLPLLVAGTGGGFGLAAAASGSLAGGLATGDALISSYDTNASSGGGGGTSAIGGGGGGTIELHAEGAVSVGKITAEGAAGGATSSILTGAAGGGSGGVIVVRAGSTATLGILSVAGGAGGTSTGGVPGTAGGVGRIRIDAPALLGVAPAFSLTNRRGVAFGSDTPLITRDKSLSLTLFGASGLDVYRVSVRKDHDTSMKQLDVTFTTPTQVVAETLFEGYNKICIVGPGGDLDATPASTNCVALAYVPPDAANRSAVRAR